MSEDERATGIAHGIHANYAAAPLGVDVPDHVMTRQDARATLGVSDGPLAICVGRISPQKGQDRLIRAWRDVQRSLPEASLILVGPFEPGEQMLGETRGLRVRFDGPVNDPGCYYAAADVVVIPSRWEGMPFVVLEAMAHRRSVVAFAAGGIREALALSAGMVAAQDDLVALAAGLTARLRDPTMADVEGEVGFERVSRLFTVLRMTERVADIYTQVLNGRLT